MLRKQFEYLADTFSGINKRSKEKLMNEKNLFNDIGIVSCGILKPEIDRLLEEGFFDAEKVIFTAPGLHEWPWELETQLPRGLEKAKKYFRKTIVLYGERCFLDSKNPLRVTETLIHEVNPQAVRINATTCVNMLVGADQREKLAGENKVYWLTPGWIKNWNFIFKDWDKGKANEMFPNHDKAVVLDALGYFDSLMQESPEEILRISDWMNLPLESSKITFDHFKKLLIDAAAKS